MSARTFAARSAAAFSSAAFTAASAAALSAINFSAIARAAAARLIASFCACAISAAVGPAGGGGAAVVVTAVLGNELTEFVKLFLAVTVNVYAVEALNPETVIGDAPPVALTPPGEEVTV